MKNHIDTIAYSSVNKADTNWLKCESGHVIKITYKDKEEAWKHYCKYFRVMLEEIPESEIDTELLKHRELKKRVEKSSGT